MKIAFQRKIDRIAGTLICWILSLFSKLKKDSSDKVKPKKILVIFLSEMGSLVLAASMFKRIQQLYPQASVYVLLFEQNKEILDIMDVVLEDHIFTIRNSSFIQLIQDSLLALSEIRKTKIDTVLDGELFARISSIYSFLSGAKIRAGFHPHTQEGLFRGTFINRPVLYNPYHHISQQFVNLVDAAASQGMPKVKRRIAVESTLPRMKMESQEIEQIKQKFYADFPHAKGKKLVLIYPAGGLLPIRAWPLEYYCELAQDILEKGYALGIIGMKTDKAIAHQILSHCKHHPDALDLTGYTQTIRELMDIFHFASLLITNDGGPGHFAAMTPISSIIFYGPETPMLYGSLSPNAFHFYVPLSCSPCLTAYNHRNSPCDGNNECLKQIHPQMVLKKVYEIMD